MLIHPFKDISWGGGKGGSTLTLKIAFKVMVEKNLILLRGENKGNLICKRKCVNHKHKWRFRDPPLEIAPSPLLTALRCGSDSPISWTAQVPGPSSLHPGRGQGSQKAQWFVSSERS